MKVLCLVIKHARTPSICILCNASDQSTTLLLLLNCHVAIQGEGTYVESDSLGMRLLLIGADS